MAAERRTPFAQAGPLIPPSPSMKYNRFNFKEHMKNHVLKINSPTYMKKIMVVNPQAESTDNPEAESDTTRRTQEREGSQPRTSRSTTPNGTRKNTPKTKLFLSKAEMMTKNKERAQGGPEEYDIDTPNADNSRVKREVAKI